MVELNSARVSELGERLASFNHELEVVAADCGRSATDITVIAVTKGFPASDMAILHSLGVRNFGESKDQEAKAKLGELSISDLSLHFIGQLQRNKARSVCGYASVIHSIDRIELLTELIKLSQSGLPVPELLLQVNLDTVTNENRGGAAVVELVELANQAKSNGLMVNGLMAVAPLGQDAAIAFGEFAKIAEEFEKTFTSATWRSIGMSGDWQQAVRAGATHLRIGSVLLGNRG